MAKGFTFGDYGKDGTFDRHIEESIRGYSNLRSDCVSFSQYFLQKKSVVLDIGCSSGAMLRRIRDYNQEHQSNTGVKYIGLDVVPEFKKDWEQNRERNISFKKADARTYKGYENLSLVYSIFTMQFMPEADRLALVKKIYDGLNDGGAFIISEKVLAKNAKFQDMLAFTYYDHKRKAFTEKQILEKEASIRDQMRLWSEFKIFEMLRSAGFKPNNMQLFWRNHLFIGIIAMKQAAYK